MNKSIVFILLFIPSICFGAISFTDGMWSTSFDCAEQSQTDAGWVDCPGIENGGGWTIAKRSLVDGVADLWTESSTSNEWYYTGTNLADDNTDLDPEEVQANGVRLVQQASAGALISGQWSWYDNDSLGSPTVYLYSAVDPDTHTSGYVTAWPDHNPGLYGDIVSQITSSANNPQGGGRGWRKWSGIGATFTGPGEVDFPTPQKELWVRWYVRHQAGYMWETNYTGFATPQQEKLIYFFTSEIGSEVIAQYYYNQITLTTQGTGTAYPVVTPVGTGWLDVQGGAPSDGEFHCFEVHIKMDTDHTDGIGQIWVNGVLLASSTTVDWSGIENPEQALAGWARFKFAENQRSTANATEMYTDFDDIVVYNTTPPNQDADGNPYIGPLDTAPTYDSPTITGPVDSSTTNTSVEIEGPYTVDPDLPDQSVIVTWTLGVSSGFAVAALGVFSCTVPVDLGVNSIVFRAVDSNDGEDSCTTVVTRTAPPSGNVIYTGSMSGGTYR